MVTVINDISLNYKAEEKKWILDEYKLNLRDKIKEFKKVDLSQEWQIYLKHAEV